MELKLIKTNFSLSCTKYRLLSIYNNHYISYISNNDLYIEDILTNKKKKKNFI